MIRPSTARAPAGRGLAGLLGIATFAVGLGLLALALDDDLAPDAVRIAADGATVAVAIVGGLHVLIAGRGLVRLFDGRFAERSERRPTRGDLVRLRLVAVFDSLTGLALVVVGAMGGLGDSIELDGWAQPAAIAAGALLDLLGTGLFVLSLRPPPGRLPPGVGGTSWRRE